MVQKLKQGALAEFSALITSCRHFERPTQGSPAVCWAGISSPVPSKAVFPMTEEEIKYNLSPVKRTVLPREMLTTRGTQLPCNSQRFLIILGSFHAITGDGFHLKQERAFSKKRCIHFNKAGEKCRGFLCFSFVFQCQPGSETKESQLSSHL